MKKFLLALAVAFTAMNISAQTVESAKFLDNTAVTVKGGVSSVMHPTCNGYQNFGHTLEASAGLGLEKWVTPYLGVGLEGTVGFTNGSKTGFYQSKNWVNYVTVMAQAKVNVANLFLGYNGQPRTFEFVPTVGIGWVHGFYQGGEYGYPSVKGAPYCNDKNSVGTKFSVDVRWNVTQRLSLVATPYLAYRFTNDAEAANRQPRFDINNSWYGLELGVSYRLGKTFKLCPYKYTQEYVDGLNGQINDLRAELAKKPTEVVKTVKEKVTKLVPYADRYTVFFESSSAELSSEGKAVLDKVPTDVSVVVKGSASPDGPKALNESLASERAEVVKNYLEGRGVKVLASEGVGTELGARVAVVDVK